CADADPLSLHDALPISRPSLLEAWENALACDSVSAFGGIVASNRPLDGATAEAICKIFTEVVVAPGADDAAREAFAKKKNLRLRSEEHTSELQSRENLV